MVIGIDLGSRNVKIIQMREGRIMQRAVFDTIQFYRKFARMQQSFASGTNNAATGGTETDLGSPSMLNLDFKQLGFSDDRIVATGYGKIAVQVQGAIQIPEIQAHVAGAVFQSMLGDFTLLDIGGQDTKVVQVRGGRAVDFLTNDRCAASSGRYVENMAAVLGMSLEELSSCQHEPVELNSTCAIFGETEIIAKIVEGHPLGHLAAGINYALYRRVASMLKKLKSEMILLSGGVAFNSALMAIIAHESRCEVRRLPEPQLNGAIGCCIYGDKED
ncbi:MAG: acyl-CoA dehydratase activase [Syntrophomonadaceae bacterium]|nr:acyl-CoA dehydratase activase [Syntrophomonadaceae bacterium]